MMYYLCMCMLTTGTGPGQTIGLNLKSWLYVGGVDWTDVRVSPSVPVDVGFVGCIAEVRPVVSHLSSLHSHHPLFFHSTFVMDMRENVTESIAKRRVCGRRLYCIYGYTFARLTYCCLLDYVVLLLYYWTDSSNVMLCCYKPNVQNVKTRL